MIYTFQIVKRSLITLICSSVLASIANAALPNPTERIEYWQENYTDLVISDPKRVENVKHIFQKILQVAGQRPGIEPRLFVIKESPFNISLPISIPDGWIILSKKVLDFCYQEIQHGDDRLAFILAHEVAHHLENDFWHMKFFQTIASSQNKSKKISAELQSIAQQSNKIRAKELRADELGIIYTLMANYNINAVVGSASKSNFFDDWFAAHNPIKLLADNQTTKNNETHPSTHQRIAAVRARLEQVADKGDLFVLGVLIYQTGNFKRAIQSFEKFQQYYPGSEVYLNLGASYHQLAMQYYPARTSNEKSPPLKTSVAIDPLNRASRIANRSTEKSSQKFEKTINSALNSYKKAISLDPDNVLAYSNIASAYLLLNKPYKAISHLQDAENIGADNAWVLNNLGVAFYKANNYDIAIKYLKSAKTQGAKIGYATPLYNLGAIAHHRSNSALSKKYWKNYLSKNDEGAWAYLVNKTLGSPQQIPTLHKQREMLVDLEIGAYVEEIPTSWGNELTKTINLGSTPFSITRYSNGVTTVAESDEVRLLATQPGFTGTSTRGIKIGYSEKEVLTRYGRPEKTYLSRRGKSLSYVTDGITFQISAGKVASWVLFWD